jgi:hypothetical protein
MLGATLDGQVCDWSARQLIERASFLASLREVLGDAL